MSAPIVVVGGGLAAARAVMELRDAGHDGEVVVLAEEHEVPYERPPLSKGFLQGEESRDSTYVQPREWYAEHGIDLRLGERVEEIDLDALDRALERGQHLLRPAADRHRRPATHGSTCPRSTGSR